ncbi:MAG: cyclic nucleotide-binding domain-containing protein [Spirochaetaceae bacterium]
MGAVGFINSDIELQESVSELFNTSDNFEVLHLDNKDGVSDFLDYELSEIIIINFSDTSEALIKTVVHKIQEDSWLHSFGIIGIYNDKDNEEELLKKYSDVNIMVMMNQRRLRSHLIKSIDIISRERHIIFQKVLIDNLMENASGTFLIESDVFIASIYSSIITTALSQRGVISSERKMFLQLVLSEMIVNGIEHGNCGISYDEKSEFLEKGLNIVDLIAHKCKDPAVARKRVYFEWSVNNDETIFVIRDEGEGFDVDKLKARIEAEGSMALHGRGIKMAVKIAKEIRYNKKGNRLKLVFDNEVSIHKDTPEGFGNEEVLNLNKGDLVFQEDEIGDFLYYIIAGTYDVYVEEVLVGRITPSDVFMGEMAFLLQNHRSATVYANCPGKLLKISRNSYINAIKKYPHYAILLSKLLAKKLVRANDFKVKGELTEE